MERRRRFGALEAVFVLLAVLYLGYVVFFSGGRGGGERDTAVAVVEATVAARITEPADVASPQPTQTPVRAMATAVGRAGNVSPELAAGWGYEQANDPAGALIAYNAALADAPTHPELLLARGRMYFELAQYDNARADFDEALLFAPITLMGEVYYWQGRLAAAAGDDDTALERYNDAIDADENFAPAYNGRGEIYLERENYNVARLDFERAIDLNNSEPLYPYNLGLLYEETDETRLALEAYRKAVALDPGYVDAMIDLASLLTHTGEYAEAVAIFDTVIALAPDNDLALHQRGYAYAEWGDYPAAIASYTAAINYAPGDAVTWRNRGLMYYRVDEYERALADFDEALRLEPDNDTAYNNRGLVRRALGDIDGALADYDRSLELKAENGADDADVGITLSNRGFLYLQEEDYALAEQDLVAAAALIPENANVWLWLGDVYAETDRETAATAAYRRHIDLAGDRALSRAYAYTGIDPFSAPQVTR